jgi:threonine/homoserine/homoserine lactone efflux protein
MEGELIGLWLLSKGFVAGLAIAVPVGPVNVLCASRTLRKGRLSGLISGFGAATADALYGAVAGFSITFLIQFLEREQFWIRVIGGLLLIAIGVLYFRKPAQSVGLNGEDGETQRSDYASTLLLTLTNPTTILSFLAVLAGLGMGGHRMWWLTFLLVGGIFCGSMLWWVALVLMVNRFRDRFNQRAMRIMNQIAGLAIGGFGVATLFIGIKHGP